MDIRRYDSGILASNMYILSENGHAVVIDPARIVPTEEDLQVDLLIITHEHYDHISGVNAWKEEYRAPLLCSEICAERITDARKNQARYFDAFCKIQSWTQREPVPEIDPAYSCKADLTFNDCLLFEWQGHRFRLIEIPGHSPGSIGIYVDENHFFSGDSLLKDAETELRFPSGSRKQWEEIGEPRIRAIPKGTVIWPGHFERFVL